MAAYSTDGQGCILRARQNSQKLTLTLTLAEQLIMDAAKRSAPLSPTWTGSQLPVPRTEPLRLGLAQAAVQVLPAPVGDIRRQEANTAAFEHMRAKSREVASRWFATGIESIFAWSQACGTMFLLLGGAWSRPKVGQSMLDILTMVRLQGLRTINTNEALCNSLPDAARYHRPCIDSMELMDSVVFDRRQLSLQPASLA